MAEDDWLGALFEASRPRLRAVAYRMLGSSAEADDAVQETWLRLRNTDHGRIDNLGGWLTTVVARVSLDMLRSRGSRREDLVAEPDPEPSSTPASGDGDPEHEALVADAIGPALLLVLDTLTPAERLAFVLHDMFAVPFEEIAPIIGRTPAAARQLASRARRRVQGSSPTREEPDTASRWRVVNAFLAASREGDFRALLAVLDPDAVCRADAAAVGMGAVAEVRGAAQVARVFDGRARATEPAIVDGSPGAVWAVHGQARVAFAFTIVGDRVAAVDLIADPERLDEVLLPS